MKDLPCKNCITYAICNSHYIRLAKIDTKNKYGIFALDVMSRECSLLQKWKRERRMAYYLQEIPRPDALAIFNECFEVKV